LEFRSELATEMIHNPDVPIEEDDHQSKERRCKKQKQVYYELQTLPRKCARANKTSRNKNRIQPKEVCLWPFQNKDLLQMHSKCP
jgi:hypothetical protein